MKPIYTPPLPTPLDPTTEVRLVIGDFRPPPMRSLDCSSRRAGHLYIAVCRRFGPSNRFLRQTALRVADLRTGGLRLRLTLDDTYVSQAVFKRPNRRKENLQSIALLYLDIDFPRTDSHGGRRRGAPVNDAAHLARVLAQLDKVGVPRPSYVLASGRGLHLKWLTDILPAKAASRWSACMRHLCDLLKALGADANALDTSRILRAVGSRNTRAHREVRELWSNRDPAGGIRVYRFDKLARAILPRSREHSRKRKDAKVSVRPKGSRSAPSQSSGSGGCSPRPKGRTPRELWQARLRDIERLFERRGYQHRGVDDGLRVKAMLVMAVALSHMVAPGRILPELRLYRDRYVPHWSDGKLRQSVATVLRLAADGKTLTYRDATLRKIFDVTADERHWLPTLGPTEAERKEKKRVRERHRRRAAGATSLEDLTLRRINEALIAAEMWESGATWQQVAAALGISRAKAFRLRPKHGD